MVTDSERFFSIGECPWPRSTPYVPLPVVRYRALEPIQVGSRWKCDGKML